MGKTMILHIYRPFVIDMLLLLTAILSLPTNSCPAVIDGTAGSRVCENDAHVVRYIHGASMRLNLTVVFSFSLRWNGALALPCERAPATLPCPSYYHQPLCPSFQHYWSPSHDWSPSWHQSPFHIFSSTTPSTQPSSCSSQASNYRVGWFQSSSPGY